MYEDLLRRGLLKRETVSHAEASAALARARRDLSTAGELLGKDDDWALAVAYNGVLQAGRGLMFSQGYRPSSVEGHKTVMSFLRDALAPEHSSLVTYFDRVRVKRHTAIYDVAGLVTRRESADILARASQLIEIIASELP
jgi:uncharacterized protein (UPF0332 family)